MCLGRTSVYKSPQACDGVIELNMLRYQTLNPGVGSGRDADAWPYLPTLLPRFAGHSVPYVVSLAIRLRSTT